jgi:hypothetical protein
MIIHLSISRARHLYVHCPELTITGTVCLLGDGAVDTCYGILYYSMGG